MRNILILAAKPQGTDRLHLDEEVKKIEQGLERSKKRDQFKLVVKWAVTDDDDELCSTTSPRSSSSRGTAKRMAREAPARGETWVLLTTSKRADWHLRMTAGISNSSRTTLGSSFFELCADFVKCVVLNACYSEVQASAISQHIDWVIGMKKAVGDQAAIKFAVGFYDAPGAGRDFESAFKSARPST